MEVENYLPRRAISLVITRGISGLGTSMTVFGLDVWIFKATGSYEIFAYLALLATLPNLLLAPFAGMIVDRYNKKWLLLACELISMAAVFLALWHYSQGSLGVGEVAWTVLALSFAGTIRWIVMGVTISMLVPRPLLGRVNAIQQSLFGLTIVAGPILGAAALEFVGFAWLLIFDLVSCVVALMGLLVVESTRLRVDETKARLFSSFWHEVGFGFNWIRQHRALLHLMLFFMFFNLGVSVFSVAFTPYILSFASSQVLGASLGFQGAGAFLAGILLARLRGRIRPAASVLVGAGLFGCLMFAWGVSRMPALFFGLSCCAGALTTLIMSSSQTIWQNNVPTEIQGRVFSCRMVVSFSLGPLAILASIPAANHVFLPILSSVQWVDAIWGASQGGALGMMVSALGIAIVFGCAWLYRRGGLIVDVQADAVPAAQAVTIAPQASPR